MEHSAVGYPLFCIVAILICGITHALLWRHSPNKLLPLSAWALTIAALISGWFISEKAGEKEQTRLVEMLMGYAPTYALELERLGHAELPSDAAPDDPRYLALIQAQIRWLSANPTVNDIYTIRKTEDSRALIVDSETDYDHNGKFEGDTEARTDIGEIYDEADPELDRALNEGIHVFSPEPVTDRWGVWVGAYAPMFNPDGSVDAVVGVDFDAREWVNLITRAKAQVMGLVALGLLLLYGATSTATVLMKNQASRGRLEAAEIKQNADAKFKTLVNSIQGIVFEWNPNTEEYQFISAQVQKIIGINQKQWLEGEWKNAIHCDDREWVLSQRQQVAVTQKPYSFEFRIHDTNGQELWMHEIGTVSEEGGELTFRGVLTDVTVEKMADAEMETLNKQLVEASRQAGMAEIASGVLHNIGNVLNSVNVAGEVIKSRMEKSRLPNLRRLAQLVSSQEISKLPEFFASEKGRIVPDYLDKLTEELTNEQVDLTEELDGLARNVEHIKDIVMMQQAYAKIAGRLEPVNLDQLLDDALRINTASFSNHKVKVEKQYRDSPTVMIDRHKLLQILVNLVRNAKHALDHDEVEDRILTAKLGTDPDGSVLITISDNGIGIPPENLARIFGHGFTTKQTGHGFGLHISAVAIKEMGGELTAASEGTGKGASFTVKLPAYSPDTSSKGLKSDGRLGTTIKTDDANTLLA